MLIVFLRSPVTNIDGAILTGSNGSLCIRDTRTNLVNWPNDERKLAFLSARYRKLEKLPPHLLCSGNKNRVNNARDERGEFNARRQYLRPRPGA